MGGGDRLAGQEAAGGRENLLSAFPLNTEIAAAHARFSAEARARLPRQPSRFPRQLYPRVWRKRCA